MNYIICYTGYKSALSIADKMSSDVVVLKKGPVSGNWFKWNGNKFIHTTLPTFTSDDVIIRWGNHISLNENGATIINSVEPSRIASDKKECRLKLKVSTVLVPYSVDYSQLELMDYPYIARPPKHHGGSDFHVINNPRELINLCRTQDISGWYFQRIIDKSREFRVHVAHGKVLVINEKPLIEGELRGNQSITEASWGDCVKWNDYIPEMCKLACEAVKTVGLDFGAVDIMQSVRGDYFVAEINTSPQISDSEYCSSRYAKFFDWRINNRTDEPFDFTQYTRGKSFAWKNSQLGGTDESET